MMYLPSLLVFGQPAGECAAVLCNRNRNGAAGEFLLALGTSAV